MSTITKIGRSKSDKVFDAIVFILLTLIMLVVAYLLISARGEAPSQAPARVFGAGELLKAALFAAGYAGLNMAISVGVVCECGDLSRRGRCRMPLMFGLMMLMMMFLSNALYLQHPRVMDEVWCLRHSSSPPLRSW